MKVELKNLLTKQLASEIDIWEEVSDEMICGNLEKENIENPKCWVKIGWK